jgi:leader peptidase (prepilin peptidase)/N-methyltransferase
MMRIFGTLFAGLVGLCFGSFLNVCLSRWPERESVVEPRSHCRHCTHTLSWWENIPLLSWLILRGRCRNCRAWIGWRYPLVELAVGVLWAVQTWDVLPWILDPYFLPIQTALYAAPVFFSMLMIWLLIALAVLDAEHLWLPDWMTIPGILIGIVDTSLLGFLLIHQPHCDCIGVSGFAYALHAILDSLFAAGLILLIRWVYWLVRKREGLGLGDVKLMALLAAWLGLKMALLSFGLGVFLGALVALILLAIPAARRESGSWSLTKLPLGTFLCIGGIVSSLWGESILNAYLHWAGF